MSTHNICFYREIRKIEILFGWKKRLINSYGHLSTAMYLYEMNKADMKLQIEIPQKALQTRNTLFILSIVTP